MANPTISNVAGTFTHDSSITITGTNYGTKSTAAPDLWDTVDNIGAYSALNDGDTIPTTGGAPWTLNDGSIMKYETSDTMRHARVSAMYKGQTGATGGYLGGRTVSGATKLYVSWWIKSSLDVSGGHSSKFIRLNGPSGHESATVQTLSWTQNQLICFNTGETCLDPPFPDYTLIDDLGEALTPTDTWHFMELFADNTSGNQIVVAKTDNGTHTNNTQCGSTWNWDYVWRIGFDRGGTSPPSPLIHMSEIYVDNTPQRVYLGDAATYATCAHLEMQIPSVWSGTSITTTLNQGSFGDTDTVYVYVANDNNEVNASGFQITLGAAAGATPRGSSLGGLG